MDRPKTSDVVLVLLDQIRACQFSFQEADAIVRVPHAVRTIACLREAVRLIRPGGKR